MSPLDMVKWLLAAAIAAGGLWGFYNYAEQVLTLYRVLGLLAAFAIAVGIGATTSQGGRFIGFMKAANVERQKVVWPTKPEVVQTTIAVIVVVIIVGIMIWAIDWIFAKLVALLVG